MQTIGAKIWGTQTWKEDNLRFELGTLKLELTKTATDISTKAAYPEDPFGARKDPSTNEWRTALSTHVGTITLQPVTPDRNIVARPILNLFVPAKSETTIYVGYPSWIRAVTESGIQLLDLASELMSETWLGPDTRTGEVAYATPTHARLDRNNLPSTPHIARTPVIIQNDSPDTLQINRVSIPAPVLHTYLDQGRLWTQPVTIHCDESLSEAMIEIGNSPPSYLGSPAAASPPRRRISSNRIRQAIGFLLG